MKIKFQKDFKSGKKGMTVEVSSGFGELMIKRGIAKKVGDNEKVTYEQFPKKSEKPKE